MKVSKVEVSRDIILKPIADRWYEVQGAFYIDYTTDCGKIRVNVDETCIHRGCKSWNHWYKTLKLEGKT